MAYTGSGRDPHDALQYGQEHDQRPSEERGQGKMTTMISFAIGLAAGCVVGAVIAVVLYVDRKRK